MEKVVFKPGNMLYPLPVVMVSCSDENGNNNIITVAWCGTVCTNPPMVSVSIRPERYSYKMIEKTREFVINLTTEDLVKATDYCGVRSGRDTDKFKDMGLTPIAGQQVKAPLIQESPVNIECRLREITKLGSHDMFLADVVAVNVNKEFLQENGKFELNHAKPVVYSHGDYYGIGNLLGTFGYSVRKKKKK
jgi:flavin reductase (DIM6/NTAB) family NADH-FMN oxidoreductase RutF